MKVIRRKFVSHPGTRNNSSPLLSRSNIFNTSTVEISSKRLPTQCRHHGSVSMKNLIRLLPWYGKRKRSSCKHHYPHGAHAHVSERCEIVNPGWRNVGTMNADSAELWRTKCLSWQSRVGDTLIFLALKWDFHHQCSNVAICVPMCLHRSFANLRVRRLGQWVLTYVSAVETWTHVLFLRYAYRSLLYSLASICTRIEVLVGWRWDTWVKPCSLCQRHDKLCL